MHRDAVVSTVLLGVAMASFSAGAEPGGNGAQSAPRAELDFRFSPPRFSIGVRGGWAFNRANGGGLDGADAGIYEFLTTHLTLQKSDFDAFAFAMDFSWQLTPRLETVFGFEVSSGTTTFEFRDFVDEFGAPIVQDTTLTQVPLTVSVRLYPFERGRRVSQYAWVPATFVPYIGGGIGATWYQLKQTGEFVDFVPDPEGFFPIFEAVLESNGWTFAGHAFAGLDIKLTRSIGFVLEGRYYWAAADLGGSFVGFPPIDLNGARVMAGLNWKF